MSARHDRWGRPGAVIRSRGLYAGWTLAEIAAADPVYLRSLSRRTPGQLGDPAAEIDAARHVLGPNLDEELLELAWVAAHRRRRR